MKSKTLAVFLAAGSVGFGSVASHGEEPPADLTLWYQRPAADSKPMDEALPIGNGRMGALIFGAPQRERLSVNEDSLWTGGENPTGDYDQMGGYQVLGNILVNLPGHTNALNYRRELNLADAVSGVGYSVDGVHYERKFFCSHPAGVLVAQFLGGRKGGYTGGIELDDSHHAKISVKGNRITAAGTLDNGMKFEWQALLLNHGGKLSAVGETNALRIEFADCDDLTLLIGAGTDYVFDYAKQYHGDDPHARVTAQLDLAATASVAALLTDHRQDYQALFDRVRLDLGKSSQTQEAWPTDRRKLAAALLVDPGLDALQFQYGRYLLISCSRPGGLPANLQGLWNDNNHPAWHGDYHANINIQMNYWPAEVTGLAECHTPFFDLIGGGDGFSRREWQSDPARFRHPHLAQHHRRHGLEMG
jgi:alpha-L-fucosidase 2